MSLKDTATVEGTNLMALAMFGFAPLMPTLLDIATQ